MVKIHHTTLGNQVYSIIWEQIVSHKLRSGDKISDLRLSEELGVSRTPIREALHRLSQDGIVRSESRRGFFVTTISSQDVGEVYNIRAALEVLAVRLALPRSPTPIWTMSSALSASCAARSSPASTEPKSVG